ncbi:hypothetical protein LOAG_12460 [Loa loa]|uniref:Uncharacterized protein n=1 Tax=Loa loa TaxID=7209 RepID=A0A1S0TL59_LOALO|nr:hypothetical protein LOAG_12460 [Loa loa]EFO16048.1 hypothetical protein LOAG_12460 [Loa loa]
MKHVLMIPLKRNSTSSISNSSYPINRRQTSQRQNFMDDRNTDISRRLPRNTAIHTTSASTPEEYATHKNSWSLRSGKNSSSSILLNEESCHVNHGYMMDVKETQNNVPISVGHANGKKL